LTIVVLSAGMLGQSAPPACPAGRPVDDIITEVHKQQSKKKHRTANPLPDFICLWGWCRNTSARQTPPTTSESAPPAKIPGGNDGIGSRSAPVDQCDQAMTRALEAAHNIEVGDYSFSTGNYSGALPRYKDAAEEKPGDAAIHVRLGRVFEKLGQVPEAIEQYKTAQELAGPKPWSDEAKAALLRLKPR
jgi:tetratricopeptide (TPR) repeat protein